MYLADNIPSAGGSFIGAASEVERPGSALYLIYWDSFQTRTDIA